MSVDLKKLVAAISPDIYCNPKKKEKVKKLVKSDGYLKAAKEAELKGSEFLDIDEIEAYKSPFKAVGNKAPVESHKLVYDASSQILDPVYFWILDFLESSRFKPTKLIDNFAASPNSGYFAETGQRLTRMQEEGMKIMQTVGVLTKSVINLIYDLKEFKIRLAHYDDANSKDKHRKQAGLLALKQIWMDSVDIKRGVGSINGLSQGQLEFVTLRDAFMKVESLPKIDKIDLNDRVKRILKQRYGEFLHWIDESEKELRKRFDIEKNYLKSQINSVRMYARWAKPYFKAAKELEQRLEPTAAMVNAFNTALFQLVLLGEGKYDPKDDAEEGVLPKVFKSAKMRKYTPLVLVEFKFQTIPDRSDQRGGFNFRGKVEIEFTSFALNEDELAEYKKAVEADDLEDLYSMIHESTEGSFDTLQKDIDDLLDTETKDDKDEKNEDDVNPFSALFSFLKKKDKEDKSHKKDDDKKDFSKGGIPKDNDYEKVVRSQAILKARNGCRRLYSTYKKAHSMPAF